MKWLLVILLVCCAGSSLAFVAERGVFEFDGRERVHYFHMPESADDNTPLVIALHGMGGNARNLRHGIGLTELLDSAGFAVVYPQGVRLPQGSRHWNAGFDFMPVDDVGYLTALAEHLISTNDLSERNVMIFGISMGGYMAYHMACHSPLPISGIAVVAGSINPKDQQDCVPGARTSLLHIHGLRDPVIPFDGGAQWSLGGRQSPSVPDVIANWASKIAARPTATLANSPHVEEVRFINATTMKEVQLLVLIKFGHDWPSEKTANYPAINDVIRFLQRHRSDNILPK